jgi:hypothetical protein
MLEPRYAASLDLDDAAAKTLEGPGNAEFNWDKFEPEEYFDINYRNPFTDDLHILQKIRDHFVDVGPVRGPGIDVGSGANLYPTLAMLPYCDEIELHERSAANRTWLRRQLPQYPEVWDEYWNRLAPRGVSYRQLSPREKVARTAKVKYGDVFKLPQKRWSIGTMFFVAESISTRRREFQQAVERFIGALLPGAPFAAAFMKMSEGYVNGGNPFPAVPVTETEVRHLLERLVDDVTVELIFSGQFHRDDYKGMILALGRAGKAKR